MNHLKKLGLTAKPPEAIEGGAAPGLSRLKEIRWTNLSFAEEMRFLT